MIISQIFIYPVKSLAGIAMENSAVTDRGLQYDRRWLLIDELGMQITQRTQPELVLFQPEISKDTLHITHKPSGSTVSFPLKGTTEIQIKVQVWDDVFESLEVDGQVSHWFSHILKKKVRLVFQPDTTERKVDPKYARNGQEIVSAADGYPVLIISQASLNDLNSRLLKPVDMLRFRPNIVLDDCHAFAEDDLQKVAIGEAELIGVKNCARCIMITNDLQQAQLGKEPLRTLSQYRRQGQKVLFGRNFLVGKEGKIAIKDNLRTL
ncbi:MOSC domain-containing protein [Marinilongibacter aquaticus]|uniref:MOSC domain-containing protein n=1 Tax=Marinilongibacter aquaticus TaxID=2975157 RepID=UPI0021BD7702|nr:MOSC N-terminal beta barrel domain-containing protein [Marinilongibacter aquaticus]UBM58832.1 MOSC domain-containing protein [Marinilongibacter aquaticus]